MPKTPVSRCPSDRGAAWGDRVGALGVGVRETLSATTGCCPSAACAVFQAKRGSVNTASAHTKVTAQASTVRRRDI